MRILCLIFGFILDLLLGEKSFFTHPVVIMGKGIEFFEEVIREILPKTKIFEFIGGIIIFIVITVPAFAIIFMITSVLSSYERLIFESWCCFKMLAVKSLKTESMKVYSAIMDNDIERARTELSYIVGRDTENLNEEKIITATVETIAENTSDGVISPMFYMALGGGSLISFYKAVNTLDSMIGYRNDKYEYFGKFSAKLDDILNYIPARLTALFMIIAGVILKLDYKNGFKIFRRDRNKSKSPNAAQSESVCAGLLNIQLGGDSYYFGKLAKKDFIGDNTKSPTPQDIILTNRILYLSSIISTLVFTSLIFVVRSYIL